MIAKERAETYRSIIEQMIKEQEPKSKICQRLNIQVATLEHYLKLLDIKYLGQQNKKGQQKGSNKYKPAAYYIDNNIPISGHFLLKRLLRDGLKQPCCEMCGMQEWLGSEENLVLELHHIDGNHYNNAFDNLQVLCPNCHAAITRMNHKLNKQNKKQLKKNICPDCGEEISANANYCKHCCKEHLQKKPSLNKPSRQILKNFIRTESFTEIATKFNVSANCIRVWCKSYNLPTNQHYIKQYADDAWELI